MSEEDDLYFLDRIKERLCGCKIYHYEIRQEDDEISPWYFDEVEACCLHSGKLPIKLSIEDLPKLEIKLKNIESQIAFIKGLSQ